MPRVLGQAHEPQRSMRASSSPGYGRPRLGPRRALRLPARQPVPGRRSAACAWHQDPEHGDEIDVGAMWARPTYVVSCGETRRFAFRRCREHNGRGDTDGERHFATPLFSGDVVIMHSDCNDNWEHSVLAGQGEGNQGARVLLVFKRALAGRDGRRGHTLQGQGRRARSRQSAAAGGSASAVSTPRPSYKPSRTKSSGRHARNVHERMASFQE